MIRLMVAAPVSGSGKTVLTCALLTAFRNRGLCPCAFKCGPDYIDPMFHRAVTGVESRNLDLFLMGADRVRSLYARSVKGHGAAVCEAAMGFYDGLGGCTDTDSPWRMADALRLPVLLTVRARGAALSLGAVIRGMRTFREDSRIAGCLLNDCPPALFRTLAPALERETGVPMLGCLPHLPEAEIPGRHLGLYTAPEIRDLRERFSILAQALEAHVDMARLLVLFEGPEPEAGCSSDTAGGGNPYPVDSRLQAAASCTRTASSRPRLAAARDEAFCFTYAETLETLTACGAELVPFSPLRDTALPSGTGGLYLPGGYPEEYAKCLSENRPMREAIAAAVRDGMPTVAECGGFLYLGASLRDSGGAVWPMAGVLPGECFPTGRLVRFGYGTLTADTDSLLFRAGEAVPMHEFHHWDSTEPGAALSVTKPVTGRFWRCGYATGSLYAGFPHLCFAGRPALAERFVDAARRYGERNAVLS